MNVPHDPLSRNPLEIFRHYVGDIVYGANDGMVTTFTVVSGVAGARLPPAVVLIIGFVNLVADGFSMGASNFLAIRSVSGAEGRDRGYREPILHALATFGAFVVAGVVPLLAYIVPGLGPHRFLTSAVATGLVLFAVGATRSFVDPRKSTLRCGTEMLIVGSIAAAVAYGVGVILGRWVQTGGNG